MGALIMLCFIILITIVIVSLEALDCGLGRNEYERLIKDQKDFYTKNHKKYK